MATWLQTNNIEMVNGYLCRCKYVNNGDYIICSHFSLTPNGNWGYMTTAEGNLCNVGSGYFGFSSSTLGLTTNEEWSNWLTNNQVQIVVKLSVPTLITTLTPPQLKTLRGQNNIWSNANENIELSYWKH